MNTQEVIEAESTYLVQTYKRPEMVLAKGEGTYVFDIEGRRYLDFVSGIAVNALGYGDAAWATAVTSQAQTLAHISNLYHSIPHVELAKRLVEHSFADRVFFCNSGTEANEAALKFARKYARQQTGRSDKTGFVSFSQGFHGRSMGALAVTHKAQYREPFAPLIPGVAYAPFNDVAAAAAVITADTCAVIVEPVQGEGGVHPATPAFLQALRHLCDTYDALLIFDEVQCGLGRTGRLWGYEHYDVVPDMMTIAKPLAGGLPIGAALVTEAVAAAIGPGDHGTTFGGGPLVCQAAQVVFDRVNQGGFLQQVAANGAYLQHRLKTLESDHIVAVRGLGLMVGVACQTAVTPLITAARERGLLIVNAGENVLRLVPPLIVTQAQIDEAVEILARCLDEWVVA